MTNYPQQLTVRADVSSADVSGEDGAGFVSRVLVHLDQWLCGLRGHDPVLHFEGKRVMMRCTSCRHDSPGWEITGHAPRRLYEGDARRHLLATQRLVLRKTA
ncbi:MAG TPA: hypothetical protein VFX12_11090 [Vicinamibacterales bacterium]|nr:hypothetical protein [Vicinamibacterales bacterium]